MIGNHSPLHFDMSLFDFFAAAVTYEWENVPAASAESLATKLPVHPAPAALRTAQDNACAFVASGMTETVECTSRPAASATCTP